MDSKLEDPATITVNGNEVFTSRMREHKVEVTVDNKAHHLFPGPYVVSTFKEIVHVPATKVLEQVVGGELKLLDDAATIELKGGEVFISRSDRRIIEIRPPEQLEELRRICPDAKDIAESGVTFVLLPGLVVPGQGSLDGLLCPQQRDGYPTRLLLSRQILGKGTTGRFTEFLTALGTPGPGPGQGQTCDPFGIGTHAVRPS